MRKFAAPAPVLLWVALAWAPPVFASAQSPRVLSHSRLAPVRDRLQAAVAAAEAEHLPSEWLLDKVAEGLSKNVAPPLIARAVDGLLSRMRMAEALLRDVPNARGRERRRLLRAAVDALTAGAPPDAMGRLVRDAARGDRAGAPARTREVLVTVAELAERSFSGRAAVEATADAYRRARLPGLDRLLRRARGIGAGDPHGRDAALREAGRAVTRTVDRPSRRRDHGSHDSPPGPPGARGRGVRP